MNITALITAAGKGSRMGLGKNKLLIFAGAKTILEHTVQKFLDYDGITEIVIAAAKEDIGIISYMFKNAGKPVTVIQGGDTRTVSVSNGLKAVNKECDIVLIHDGARPFVSANIIKCCIDDVKKYGSAVTAIAVTDTIKKADLNFMITDTVERDNLYCVQTPQGFIYKDIAAAYSKINGECYTDDSSVYERYIGKPYICMGETANIKITYYDDIKSFFKGGAIRNGIGYDSHRFCKAKKFILGGTDIPYEKGLEGHSDADALCHAVIDGLFSAAGLPDIGTHFPDTEQKYKGVNSIELLKECRKILNQKNFAPCGVSAVIICEKPKLLPYINGMKINIANALEISSDNIGISAKTNEGMGFTGRGEGVFVIANCTVNVSVVV